LLAAASDSVVEPDCATKGRADRQVKNTVRQMAVRKNVSMSPCWRQNVLRATGGG
jgi:hypothetical protein